ncbi:MAG: hypothetical protein ABIN95_13155 [Mucilaginibacter sp.]
MERDRDKELDDLFKNAMQNSDQHTNFREEDWDSMQEMLDSRGKGRIAWLRVAGGIAAMLLVAIGWWALRSTGTIPTKKHYVVQKSKPRSVNPIEKAGNSVLNNEAQKGIIPLQAEKEIIVSKQYALDPDITHFGTKQDEDKQDNVELPASAGIGPDSTSYKIANQPLVVAPTVKTGGPTIDSISKQPEVIAAIEPATETSTKQNLKIKQPEWKPRPVFTLSVLAAPDVNGVNSLQNGRGGSNFGVMFSVGLGKKFTVSTGALYGYKPYISGAQSYTNGYKNYNVQSVTADCRVLDIPLNIDYKLYSKQRNSISVGTGISSYLMLNEKYTFNNAAAPTIDISNQNKHLFGVLNLQATYTRQLNSRFGVSLQPFLKLPLTNIGYGAVKLRSAGVAAGFSWNINTNSRR